MQVLGRYKEQWSLRKIISHTSLLSNPQTGDPSSHSASQRLHKAFLFSKKLHKTLHLIFIWLLLWYWFTLCILIFLKWHSGWWVSEKIKVLEEEGSCSSTEIHLEDCRLSFYKETDQREKRSAMSTVQSVWLSVCLWKAMPLSSEWDMLWEVLWVSWFLLIVCHNCPKNICKQILDAFIFGSQLTIMPFSSVFLSLSGSSMLSFMTQNRGLCFQSVQSLRMIYVGNSLVLLLWDLACTFTLIWPYYCRSIVIYVHILYDL